MTSRIIKISVALALTLLAGCSSAPTRSDGTSHVGETIPLTAESVAANRQPVVDKAAKSTGIDVEVNEDKSFEPPKPEIQLGSGKFIDESAARRVAPLAKGEGQVDFNFENNPIQSVVKAILGDLLQENYTIAPNVGGNVSFSTSKPIRADQAMSVLEMLLSWTGNTLVYQDGR